MLYLTDPFRSRMRLLKGLGSVFFRYAEFVGTPFDLCFPKLMLPWSPPEFLHVEMSLNTKVSWVLLKLLNFGLQPSTLADIWDDVLFLDDEAVVM